MSTFFYQISSVVFAIVVVLYQIMIRFRPTTRPVRDPIPRSLDCENGGLYQLSDKMATLRGMKDMYYKLQNLERYPAILPQARDTLLMFFSEALESASAKLPTSSGILSIESYDKEKLAVFMSDEQEKVTKYWEEYVSRRRAGHPRELFKTREDAKTWIKQASPLKYVDGAWLGHLNKISTPFALRRITKDAWQVMSEEYGDGDLEKHHAHLYSKLVQVVDPILPRSDTKDFIHPRHGLDDISVWKAAVAQLLVSLFPHDFLPEILGFNLHFEGLSEETLIASRELRELGIDAYYFLLHISIDNADSGHTAIALQTVVHYMEYLRETNDDQALQRAWKGVQAGFLLSQNLSSGGFETQQATSEAIGMPQNMYEPALEKIFLSKSLASHRIHCNTRIRVGARTLSEWLIPSAMASHTWRVSFLRSLSFTKELVHRGDSERSKIVQEISWKGKMFGAFTESEVKVVRGWIDSLPPVDQAYWEFIAQPRRTSADVLSTQNITVDYPVFPLRTGIEVITSGRPCPPQLEVPISNSIWARKPNLNLLLPLWFTHPALLEYFVIIPSKTATVFGCSILRFIRAQSGFGIEGPGVAGIEESRRNPIGLVEIGLELARSESFDEPISIQDALNMWPSDFALEMLKLAVYPEENVASLLGLASAFTELHKAYAFAPHISKTSRDSLSRIAKREDESLQICLEELNYKDFSKSDYETALRRGRLEITSCFY